MVACYQRDARINGNSCSEVYKERNWHNWETRALLACLSKNLIHALGTCDAFLRSVGAQALRGGLAKNENNNIYSL